MVVILCLVSASVLAALPQAVLEAPPTNPRHFPQQLNSAEYRMSAPGPAWASLERLSIEERLNSDVHIVPQQSVSEAAAAEVRAIEQLWNSGQYDAALARFRRIGVLADPSGFFVGANWRTPIPTTGTDWGPNIRVGNRDSAYCTAFDRNYVNGNLLVSLLRHAGALTCIDTYLSTDDGQSWSETFDGSWASPPSDLEGACCSTYFYVAYPYPPINQVLCLKFDAANGHYIQFPSGTWADTMFQPAPDTVTEIAMCAAEEQWPGIRVFAFGRTTRDSLLYAWTDGTGQPWHRFPTTIGWCNGGMIDCVVNTGYPTGGNWLWASFMYKRTADTLHPAFAYLDDSTGSWHASWISNLPTTTSLNTSIAAWKDTVLEAYTHQGGGRFYTQAIISRNSGGNWTYTSVPDTLAGRETPDVTGTHGGGFALAHREYGPGSDRAIMFTHASYTGSTWSAQDTVSDHAPTWIEHPRIQWVAPGTYGVAYLSWESSDYNSVWFSRSDWTGIAETRPAQPTRFGLQAQAVPGGTRLAFTNPVAGNVYLRVFDAAGRMVESRKTFLGVGAQTLGFSSSTAGIYFAELEAAGRTSVAKFFVTR